MLDTTCSIELPPWRAFTAQLSARLRAWSAFSAFCLTVEVSSSMVEAVSARAAACCSVREASSVLPALMVSAAVFTSSALR